MLKYENEDDKIKPKLYMNDEKVYCSTFNGDPCVSCKIFFFWAVHPEDTNFTHLIEYFLFLTISNGRFSAPKFILTPSIWLIWKALIIFLPLFLNVTLCISLLSVDTKVLNWTKPKFTPIGFIISPFKGCTQVIVITFVLAKI